MAARARQLASTISGSAKALPVLGGQDALETDVFTQQFWGGPARTAEDAWVVSVVRQVNVKHSADHQRHSGAPFIVGDFIPISTGRRYMHRGSYRDLPQPHRRLGLINQHGGNLPRR